MVTQQPAPAEICAMDRYCAASLGGAAENCLDRFRLSPAPLAEEMCYQALRRQLSRRLPEVPQDYYFRASGLLECSLANDDEVMGAVEISEAKECLDTALRQPDLPVALRIGGRAIDAAWPLFAARQSGVDPSEQELSEVHTKNGKFLDWALHDQAVGKEAGEQSRAKMLGVLGCLGSYYRNVKSALYPGTPREATFEGAAFSHLHHQYYGITGGFKVPVSLFMSKKSARQRPIVSINFDPFARGVARGIRDFGMPVNIDVALQRVPHILSAEARGRDITELDRLLIEGLASSLGHLMRSCSSRAGKERRSLPENSVSAE